MATEIKQFTTEDIEYLRHGENPLMLRLFRPDAAGPFPVVVDIHGGAWNNGDLNGCRDRDEVLAAAGLAVAALDFRQAGEGYPTSLIDINYAIRWLKAHAGELRLNADRVGISGQSSGGHLAMLAAMRPNDPVYAGIEVDGGGSPADATVQCVAMSWPVINPLSRYRHALRSRAAEPPAKWVGQIPEHHDRYWVTDDNMIDGNPMMALERGDALELPPALWVQGRPDPVHNYADPESELGLTEPERFAHNYRKAGGEIELVYVDIAVRATAASYDPIARFLCKHLLGG